jgi:hypothetical protein
MPYQLALRDSTILAVALGAWWLVAERSAGAGPTADAVGVVCGVLMGAIVFLLHEWGHLLAGLAAGGTFPVSRNLASPFLFEVDPRNSVRQFTVMSLGGFAVTAVMIWCFYTLLPDGWMATRVARGVAVTLATLTVVIEVPLLLFTIWSGSIPAAASVVQAAPAIPEEPA